MESKADLGSAHSAAKGTILVLGGDGFCGWPTSLHLSAVGYDVVIVDNLSRRKIDVELGTESLTPIRTPQVRLAAWANTSGKAIRFHNMTLGLTTENWSICLKMTDQLQSSTSPSSARLPIP
jgi:UDP-sulfoquinovose synthase